MKITYRISQLVPYINWVYYFYAWQVKDEAEKQRMQREALVKLEELEGNYQVHAVFELFDAYNDDDDIVVFRSQMCPDCGVKHPVRVANIPCLRQQQGNPPYLCLADFIAPQECKVKSKIGLFVISFVICFINCFC